MAGLAAVFLAYPARAIDPSRMISQYIRKHWESERALTGGAVTAIAQTPDGYLWVGTQKGLLRFDGVNFEPFRQASPNSFSIGPVQQLVADVQGNLWILLQSTKVLRYYQGKFELGRDEAEFGITSIGRRSDGTVLFASLAYGTLTYRAGHFEVLDRSTGPANAGVAARGGDDLSSRLSWATGVTPHRFAEPNSAVLSMAEADDGKLWLGTQDKGLFYSRDGKVLSVRTGKAVSKINCILALPNHELWIGTDEGIVRWDGGEITPAGVPAALRHIDILSMIRDRDSNVWVGTASGLLRVNTNGVSLESGFPRSNGAVTALFEDREGNLWVGSADGIDRLRDSSFITYAPAGLQSESSGPVYVDENGRTWFAPFEGGLHWLKGERNGSVANDGLSKDIVYSISGGKGALWIGRQQGGLTHLRYGSDLVTAKTYTQADGLAQNAVYAVHQSRDGTVWAGTLSGGVSAYRNGRFTTYTTASGISSNTVVSIAETPDGTMWFATPNGLNAFSQGRWRTFGTRDGLPSENVNCLAPDAAGILWIGTASGLAFLESGHIQIPNDEPTSLREQILGIAEDKMGWLWISTSNHVLRVKRDKLRSGALTEADVREYGLEDGLHGVEGTKRHQSVFADPFGKIWFSMNRGLSTVDPARAIVSSAPAMIHIEGVSADGTPVNFQDRIRFPGVRRRITFSYAAMSLAIPERVQFKYKLEGEDEAWSKPVSTREVTFNNLGSGSYQFRVIASNSDGLWNSSEAVVPFVVEPAYWQTWWFRVSAVLAIGIAILIFFRLRVLRLTRQMNMRFEERLAERTRIAQELHDTLLQGILSASMQLHVADDHIDKESPAKPFVGRVLELMTGVIDEGRNAVRGIRPPTQESADLEQAFSRIYEEIAAPAGIDFRVLAEGKPRLLQPIIREEVYRIGREALVNAFRHSGANNVEVEVEYAPGHLRLLVRDNGIGIDPEVVRAGRDGHWGLSGMRERAERIGARLRVLSAASSGTEIELSIPGHIAFKYQVSDSRWFWLSKLKLRMAREDERKIESERK
jgi:signal transduction histidine kinase/ligand-binding sensor domain-containing protein